MPYLTIFTPCYNEEDNIAEVCRRVKDVMQTLPDYDYEHLFIDNASKDRTVELLRGLAADDRHVKVIVNTRNFGHIRSPYYGFLQSSGDAVMGCVADLQDPPELIPQFVKKWEEGYKIVIGVKTGSRRVWVMTRTGTLYYRLVGRLSEVELVDDFTGFGLYDREVVERCRETDEQYPYFRGSHLSSSGTSGPRSSTISRRGSTARPRTVSTASTNRRCWASQTIPRSRCVLPRWRDSCISVLSLSWLSRI